MATILDRIVETKRLEIAEAKSRVQAEQYLAKIETLPERRGFLKSLQKPGMRIIAEVKKASPSAGLIRADFDPVAIARIYEAHGADCISVLTDQHYFQGHLDYLIQIRAAVGLPLLRKEFIIDRYQILEAVCHGADAVLLIAECLPGDSLKELYEYARHVGLDVLIELHDAWELQRVLDTGCELVGINNRDLRTFETRLEHTIDLMPKIPRHVSVVGESGIKTNADLKLLESAGVKAILVGESLMRADDIGNALDKLRGAAN